MAAPSPVADRTKPTPTAAARKRRWVYHLLLLLPFVGTLWPPFYNRLAPELFGFPFFYWYQFVWIAIGAAVTAIAYFGTRDDRPV